MKIDDKIRHEKLQHDINRKAAKISALSSGKLDKHENLTDKEILPSIQRKIIEQAKLSLQKQTKTIEEQGKIQIDVITNQSERVAALINKDIYKEIFDEEIKEKFDEIRELTDEINHDYFCLCLFVKFI